MLTKDSNHHLEKYQQEGSKDEEAPLTSVQRCGLNFSPKYVLRGDEIYKNG